jgi:hypothetical protein
MVSTANAIFRDFETDGVPASGPHGPRKVEIREWGAWLETAVNAGLSNGGLIYDTKASMNADLAHAANASAWVIGDGAGIYRKTGASGTGTWVRIADLPYSIVYAQNDGSGTANAVKVTASVPIATTPYKQLISVPFTAANDGAMTLEINGDKRPLVTNTGQQIPAGYVKAGMAALVQIDTAGNYRLFSYGDAAASQAAAEAAQAAAEAAAGGALSNADSLVESIGRTFPDYVKYVRTAGYYEPGDGGEALRRRKSVIELDAPGDSTSNGGAVRWALAETVINPRMLGAKGDGVTDDTVAIRNAVKLAMKVRFSPGDYVVTGEIEIVKPGQVLAFDNSGGYGYGEDIGLKWQPNTRIVAKGSFPRRMRTRRLWRGSASDPQDPALSCVINVQAENAILMRPCTWLNCDYTNNSPTNLGDDCDIGIFVGCRVGVQLYAPQVIGYFRRAGIYIDVTGHTALPRLLGLDGNPYPDGTVKNGADGTHLWNPYTRGPRVGLAVLGARPKPGQTGYSDPYYDQQSGLTVSDARGSFGCSDFDVYGGRIYGPDHHSNRRLKDPILDGGKLSLASMLAEPDDAPAAMFIDGLAGNSNGALHGMNFYGTRFATFEAFRVRLDFQARCRMWGCHIEGRSGGRMDTAGNVIDTNDTVTNSYGNIAATPNAKRMQLYGTTFTSMAHNYGVDSSFHTDTGISNINELRTPLIQNLTGELDFRAGTGFGHRFRTGNVTVGTLSTSGVLNVTGSFTNSSGMSVADHINYANGELDLRGNSGIRLRHGSTTLATLSTAGIVANYVFRPATNNSFSNGNGSYKWTEIFAMTGTINTSDARWKRWRGPLLAAEKRALKRVAAGVGVFQFLDAIALKGEDARLHIGVTVQDVIAAFEAEGLDPWLYAPICKDYITETVTRTRIVARAKTEMRVTIEERIEISDGVAKLMRREVEREEPVFAAYVIHDEGGNVLYEMNDSDELTPKTVSVPVFEDVEETYEEEVQTEEYILGLRTDQLLWGIVSVLMGDIGFDETAS